MKKIILFLGIIAMTTGLMSCKSNMRRDVKRLVHKTEQCYSIIDTEVIEDGDMDSFNECYKELEVMMNKYDAKYKDKEASDEFNGLFREEIKKSDLSDDIRQSFEMFFMMNDEMAANAAE